MQRPFLGNGMLQALEQDKRTRQRLRLLIVSRVIILSIFLLAAFFMGTIKPVIFVSREVLYAIYAVISVMYGLSIVYALLLRKEKYFQFNVYFQLAVDIFLITFLVYVTGSIGSNYSLLYTLVIIYSATFLGRQGALIFASLCSVAYGLALELEYFGVIPTFYGIGHDYSVEAGDVFVRILVHVLSFYLLAFLASFVVEQEKQTRSLLQEKESAFDQLDLLFRSIIESMDTGVMTTTLEGRIKTFNRAAESITGYRLSSIENTRIQEIFPELNKIFYTEAPERLKGRKEIRITVKEGTQIYLGCSIFPLKDRRNVQIGHIVIFQDLTQIKHMEEKLEKSRRLALIGEMAAGLAHEMRNPLASITGSIQMLGQRSQMAGTDQQLMQIILRSKDRLENFVRDFLLLARPVPDARESVDVNKIAGEAVESIKVSREWTKGISIAATFSGENAAWANKEQVRQVIQNLVMNAVQAIQGPGKILLDVRTVVLDDAGDCVEVKITDDGCGIEEKDLKNIFEPFYTSKEKGTGLGLAIVSRIVDGYGGKIKIISQVNSGTSIFVWLPCPSVGMTIAKEKKV